MDNIFKSIKAFLYERTVSPLFGAFIISWLLWNYRAVMMILSDKDIYEKYQYLTRYFESYVIQLPFLTYGLLAPVIMTWLYLYIYPKFALPVYEHSLKKEKQSREIKQSIEDQRLLTIKESRELLLEITQLEEKYDTELKKARDKISVLTQQLGIVESEEAIDPELTDKENEDGSVRILSNEQETILSVFAKTGKVGDRMGHSKLSQTVDMEPIVLQHNLDELSKVGAYLTYSQHFGEYKLSKKGTKYIVENNLGAN